MAARPSSHANDMLGHARMMTSQNNRDGSGGRRVNNSSPGDNIAPERRSMPIRTGVQSMRFVVCAALIAAIVLWIVWPSSSRLPEARSDVTVVNAKAITPPPAAQTAALSASAVPTAAWLTGSWSQSDTHGEHSPSCELPTAITFLPEGRFVEDRSAGRFAADSRSITYWARVTYDIDAGEDRSRYDQRSTLSLVRLGDDAARIGEQRMFRCERRAAEEPAR